MNIHSIETKVQEATEWKHESWTTPDGVLHIGEVHVGTDGEWIEVETDGAHESFTNVDAAVAWIAKQVA